MLSQEEYRLEEGVKRWNMFFIMLFALLGILALAYLSAQGRIRHAVSLFDFFVLAFAVMRLVRLVCYDNICLFLREVFLDTKRIKYAETGEEHIDRVLSARPLKRSLWKLVNCPWCSGIWISFLVVFLYFAWPVSRMLFLLLALAAVASLLQVFANLLGWSTETKKASAVHPPAC